MQGCQRPKMVFFWKPITTKQSDPYMHLFWTNDCWWQNFWNSLLLDEQRASRGADRGLSGKQASHLLYAVRGVSKLVSKEASIINHCTLVMTKVATDFECLNKHTQRASTWIYSTVVMMSLSQTGPGPGADETSQGMRKTVHKRSWAAHQLDVQDILFF